MKHRLYVVVCCGEPYLSTLVVAKSARHARRLVETERGCKHDDTRARRVDWKRREPVRSTEPAFFPTQAELRGWLG